MLFNAVTSWYKGFINRTLKAPQMTLPHSGIMPKINHWCGEMNIILPAIRLSKPGVRTTYYEGYLPAATRFRLMGEEWQRNVLFLSEAVYGLALEGEVHLFQFKKSDFNYTYIAERASENWKKSASYKKWLSAIDSNRREMHERPKMDSKLIILPKFGYQGLRA